MKLLKFNIFDYTEDDISEFKKFVDGNRIKIFPQTAVAHYQAKKAISETLCIPPESVHFSYNEHGKPYINENIYFSITHTGQYVFIAIDRTEIAIDAEIVRPVKQALLNRIATDDDLISFDHSDFNLEFFRLWTLKEAYFKYKGTGITSFKTISKTEIMSNFIVKVQQTENYVLTILKGR